MMALALTLVFVAAGCGRVGFGAIEARADGASPQPDAAVCVAGDGVCLPACVATDSDCVTTCGDNRCVGNAGELCGNCMADCATLAVVCGNAECQAGEDGTSCYADCGPPVWPWDAEESALRTAINNARTGGTTCPGDGAPRFASTLAVDTNMQPGAREYAWEIAHHEFHMNMACNGRTFVERQATYGSNGGLSHSSAVTAAAAVASWSASATLCPVLMATNRTQLAVGVALDAQPGWVMWLK